MTSWSDPNVWREARDVVRDGLKEGVNGIISHALRQWTLKYRGFDPRTVEENRRRWLAIRTAADTMVAQLVAALKEMEPPTIATAPSENEGR